MKKPAQTKPIDATVQARLDTLEALIDTDYDGSAKVFQDKTGIKMAQVNQWFSGYRALRDKALKRLEERTGKSFDQTRTHASFTQAYPDTKAAQAPVDTAQSATNAVALSAECQSLCSMFDSLPGDALVRAKALIQIEAIIAAAREPPTKRPMPESWQDTKKSA